MVGTMSKLQVIFEVAEELAAGRIPGHISEISHHADNLHFVVLADFDLALVASILRFHSRQTPLVGWCPRVLAFGGNQLLELSEERSAGDVATGTALSGCHYCLLSRQGENVRMFCWC